LGFGHSPLEHNLPLNINRQLKWSKRLLKSFKVFKNYYKVLYKLLIDSSKGLNPKILLQLPMIKPCNARNYLTFNDRISYERFIFELWH